MLQTVLASPPGGGGPGSDTTAARLLDPRFNGIERFDIRTYGAICDGSTHPLSGIFASFTAAQAAYPNAGLTSGNWSTKELDTVAWLQGEYFLRTGSGGKLSLFDGARMMASETLWLQQGGKVHFEGGRNTQILGEQCGSNPVLRASFTGGGPTGGSRAKVFRNLIVYAWNAGRAYFGAAKGAASPGYATFAAMSGSPGGYHAGSCAIQIDNGGTSGNASVYTDIEGVRWFNFDDATRFGDDTFGIVFLNCSAENNNKGVSWAQTAGLNSMEGMRFIGGTYSNNNHPFYWVSIFNNTSPQGGSIFIDHAHIDYNQVSQGYFRLANNGNGYPQSSLHVTKCHIEGNPDTGAIGNAVWFDVVGVVKFTDNEWYINGSGGQPIGLCALGDNSSGSMVNNRIGGYCPLFYSTTSNFKAIHAVGNDCNYIGVPVIALTDASGSVMQVSAGGGVRCLVNPNATSGADFAYASRQHGIYSALEMNSAVTTFTLPANGADSFPIGQAMHIYNTDATSTITTRVPPGLYCVGLNGTVDNRSGSATVNGPQLPAKSFGILVKREAQGWAWMGPFVSTYSG